MCKKQAIWIVMMLVLVFLAADDACKYRRSNPDAEAASYLLSCNLDNNG
ncbi:hypothetical protein [Photobacterium sp. OFAV2-7]|nr:hypothetical protein [Photobacterium sp. OFAV2-7]MCG7584349.1 hypothetical protein [Photobacterium sp. OFAV2-7]